MIRIFHYNTCCVNYSIKKTKIGCIPNRKILNQLPPEWILRFTEICQRVKITVPCYDYGNDPTLKRKGKEKNKDCRCLLNWKKSKARMWISGALYNLTWKGTQRRIHMQKPKLEVKFFSLIWNHGWSMHNLSVTWTLFFT